MSFRLVSLASAILIVGCYGKCAVSNILGACPSYKDHGDVCWGGKGKCVSNEYTKGGLHCCRSICPPQNELGPCDPKHMGDACQNGLGTCMNGRFGPSCCAPDCPSSHVVGHMNSRLFFLASAILIVGCYCRCPVTNILGACNERKTVGDVCFKGHGKCGLSTNGTLECCRSTCAPANQLGPCSKHELGKACHSGLGTCMNSRFGQSCCAFECPSDKILGKCFGESEGDFCYSGAGKCTRFNGQLTCCTEFNRR